MASVLKTPLVSLPTVKRSLRGETSCTGVHVRTRRTPRSTGTLLVNCDATPPQGDQHKNVRIGAIGAAVAGASQPAFAAGDDVVLSKPLEIAVDAVDIAVDAAAEVVKTGQSLTATAKDLAEQASPYVDRAGKALAPIAQKASSAFERTVVPLADDAVKTGASAAGSSLQGLSSTLKDQGVDVAPVTSAAGSLVKSAADKAPEVGNLLNKGVNWVLEKDGTTLAEGVLAALVAYVVLPPIVGVVGDVARGYAGKLRPAQALEAVSKDSGCTLVDIRTVDEQLAKGGIAVGKGAEKRLVDLPRTTLPDRGSFRQPGDVEARLTALKLAALKAVKPRSQVIILDQSGKQAEPIAKALAKMGYSKCYVVEGGFEGWKEARLKTTAVYQAAGEVSSSMPRFSLPMPKMGSQSGSTTIDVPSRTLGGGRSPRALPPPRR